MKSFFSMVNSVVGGDTSAPVKVVILPWEDYKEKAKALNIRGSLTDIMRDKILEISLEEKIFLNKSKPLGEFEVEGYLEVIMKLLEIDTNLRELFRKCVPGRISEEIFWRNYFEKVEEVKEEILMTYSNKKSPSESNMYSAYHSSLIDELDKELEAEEFNYYQKSPPPVQTQKKDEEIEELKLSLKNALKRIEDLEKRVAVLEQPEKHEFKDEELVAGEEEKI